MVGLGPAAVGFFGLAVTVANHSEQNLSLASFLGLRRLAKVLSVLKLGNYLFIEFGYNDQKEHNPHDKPWLAYTKRPQFFIAETRRRGYPHWRGTCVPAWRLSVPPTPRNTGHLVLARESAQRRYEAGRVVTRSSRKRR